MSEAEPNYIVYAPSFNENSGGTIFLHQLAHALGQRGYDAALWPMAHVYDRGLKTKIKETLSPPPYRLSDKLDTRRATKRDIGANTVAIYPELVLGNPLGAPHVARWLLYTPGKLHAYDFGPDEMFFRVDEFADLPEVTGGAEDLFMWTVNRAYRDENRPDRKGTCFVVHKWKDGPRHPCTEGAIQIDGKSHEEINEIFNQCDTFYSYDDATMYSQYAAVSGCLSVVIPSGDAARDGMLKNHMLAPYGIAYDFSDDQIAHAKATRHKVLDHLLARERMGQETVDRFVEITRARVKATA